MALKKVAVALIAAFNKAITGKWMSPAIIAPLVTDAI
jgi:hypothetical protein